MISILNVIICVCFISLVTKELVLYYSNSLGFTVLDFVTYMKYYIKVIHIHQHGIYKFIDLKTCSFLLCFLNYQYLFLWLHVINIAEKQERGKHSSLGNARCY